MFDSSAAENLNIREIFKSFLTLSKINFGVKLSGITQDDSAKELVAPRNPALESCKLKRNLSAYGRLKSNKKKEINKMEILDALEQEHRRKIGKQVNPKRFCLDYFSPFCFLTGKFWTSKLKGISGNVTT